MADAKSLRDLLLIRNANQATLDLINGSLGTALGYKRATDRNVPEHGKPAIVVFVPRKINKRWLAPGQEIPKSLEGPDGLVCPVDVVEGSKASDILFRTINPTTGADEIQSWIALRDPPPAVRDESHTPRKTPWMA